MSNGDELSPREITQDRMEQALEFLALTDATEPQLKEQLLRADAAYKAIKDAQFLHAPGKSVADRQAYAANTDEAVAAQNHYFNCMREHLTILNRRKTADILIQVWRSKNASMRIGNVT